MPDLQVEDSFFMGSDASSLPDVSKEYSASVVNGL